MNYNHVIVGIGMENEDFFFLVSLMTSLPASLPLWRKPGHLQATVFIAVIIAEFSAISENANDLAFDERSCY